ncbi:hypothetical protein [Halomarina pelagica]|uniref:hypothetical protein n=1 Tax=Halomarina pelagica TaxID=2961599 RepID=UPI0020C3D195|nr:hypothetical protein [Halomarina sp. BND7]
MSSGTYHPSDDEFVSPWQQTLLYKRWHQRVAVGGPNDFIICITPSSKTGVSGTGKTTLATVLAKEFDLTDDGFNAEEKATLDAGELAYDILPEVESGSALIFDEAQGAPGTASVNSRRGMTSAALDAINGILANRDKRLTLIIVAQQLSMLDKLLYPMIDAWLLIRIEPTQPNGPLVTHHKIYVEDYDLGSPKSKTPALEDLSWPALSRRDPDYRTMERKKQKAKRKRSEAADELPAEIPKPLRDEKITQMYAAGISQKKIGEIFDISQSMVSQIVNS